MAKTKDNNPNNLCVIYARYSSDSQRQESIQDQIRECKAYAKNKGLTVIGTYTDEALTATTDKRPSFLRMIKESEKGLFHYVLCYKTDRFARNRADAIKYKNILKNNNVSLLYAKMAIPAGPEGIILEGVLESIDEYYSANLSQNIRRGQFGNAQNCKANGVPVFGYDRDRNDHYIVNEHEAYAVRKIYQMVIDGFSDVSILSWLKAKGYKNTLGRDFGKNAIKRMIPNRKYIGEYSFAGVVIPGGMPAIIDIETFNKANDLIGGRKKHMQEAEYILSSILYCGECGAAMYGRAGTGKKGTKYHYYSCSEKIKHNCSKNHVPKDVLENSIIDIINSFVFTDETINDILDGIMEFQVNIQDNSNLEYLNAQLHEKTRARDNIIKAIEKGMFQETMIERMNELDHEVEEINKQIATEQLNQNVIDRDFIAYYLDKFKVDTKSNIENKKRLIETFISKAFLFDDGRLVLTFNYTKNGHLATHEEMLNILSDNNSVRCFPSGGAEGNRTPVQKPPL